MEPEEIELTPTEIQKLMDGERIEYVMDDGTVIVLVNIYA